MKRTCLPIALLCLLSTVSVPAQEQSSLPYNEVDAQMKLLPSRKVGGADCVATYLKGKQEPFDPAKARPRIITRDGVEHLLEIDRLSDVKADLLNDTDRKMIDDGYTHRMWVPKGEKRFEDGALVNSLPRGSVVVSQGINMKFSLPLKKKE